MDYSKKGFLIIFAHSDFTDERLKKRNAESDVIAMEKTFTRLGFEIEICRDKTSDEIKLIMEQGEISHQTFS